MATPMSEHIPESSPASAADPVPVHEPFVRSLDALGAWRATLEERVRDLVRFLREQSLLDESAGQHRRRRSR